MLDDIMEFVVLKILGPVAVFGTLALLVALPFMIWGDSKSEHISIKKSDWECTDTYSYTYTSMILVGKVMVPQVHTTTECSNYHRRGH
jgi:hypothetical protein